MKREPKSFVYFILIDVSMCVCLCAHTYVGAQRGQKKALGPLELIQAVVGCLVWVLEVTLWSSARRTGALDSRAPLLANSFTPNNLPIEYSSNSR